MKQSLFLLFIHFSAGVFAQNLDKAQRELIGTHINELKFTDFLQNVPRDTAFNGKFKVLEFWATWCKPCLAAVPHINKLQAKFNDTNLVFLSVTHESPELTAKTLQRVQFKTVVVSDQTRAVHRNLRIEYEATMVLPRTVLVDNNNRIVWYGTPKKLTAVVIQRFLRGEIIE